MTKEIEMDSSASTVSCDKCSLTFSKQTILEIHIKSVHREINIQSEKSTVNNANIKKIVPVSTNYTKVLVTDNGVQVDKYECNICKHRVGTPSSIKATYQTSIASQQPVQLVSQEEW